MVTDEKISISKRALLRHQARFEVQTLQTSCRFHYHKDGRATAAVLCTDKDIVDE